VPVFFIGTVFCLLFRLFLFPKKTPNVSLDIRAGPASRDAKRSGINRNFEVVTTEKPFEGTPRSSARISLAYQYGFDTTAFPAAPDDAFHRRLFGARQATPPRAAGSLFPNDHISHLFKNNSGHAFRPSIGTDGIYVMQVGEGYKNGCLAGEPVTFKRWNGMQGHPLDFESAKGSDTNDAIDQVFPGTLKVPDGYLPTKFDLTQACPAPFRSMAG
jgi:hypothetical protein